MRAELDVLQEAIGHRFADRDILSRALTHSSHVHEQLAGGAADQLRDNEQLEFLGDSVLGFLISEDLLKREPQAPEGRLSKLKAHLVSAAWLHESAQNLELGQYLTLGRGEEMSGGRAKKTLLVDAFEALIAAIYLDGGMEAARQFVSRFVVAPGLSATGTVETQMPDGLTDYKSALQELAQAHHMPQPRYVIVRERGPEHSKTFTVEVRVGRDYIGQAEGLTKKGAAQKAARDVYERMQSAFSSQASA
ncbi:MAG: ribonuclease III [Bryobacteraceae bacterium]